MNIRTGRLSGTAGPAVAVQAPHAALLIDFDNVTMGIRSDLTKELKALLNSDIIRGKVTVQRAYADWRRYPQYVMPLTERSIDMIWATAVGSTKKNATDIRLAIDAIELVFTRPEIGTFIILSGDSDFSSLVLKLKEYGKYVVGIGIRESASDLLIQNCDEYYSYSELAGLNKEVDAPSVQRDPWELVREAVALMVRNGDVMRSDRLKQVMQQIDPNFDERNAGFNRFSKFVTEAGTRGLVTLTKLENGQYEVGQASGGTGRVEGEPGREDGGRRGRDRRGRERDRGDRSERAPERAERSGDRDRSDRDRSDRDRSDRDRGERDRGDRDRGDRDRSDRDRGRRDGRRAEAPEAAPERRGGPAGLTLGAAFTLLTRALAEMPNPASGDQLRARMAALHGREDPLLDTERFPRFLRQANDAEIAEVRKAGDDGYEVSLSRLERAKAAQTGGTGAAAPAAPVEPEARAPEAEAARSATLRFRRGSRAPLRPPAIPLVGVVDIEGAAPAEAPAPVPADESAKGGAKKAAPRKSKRAKSAKSAAKAETPAPKADAPAETAESAAKPAKPGRGRGRGRSKAAKDGKEKPA
ncbi:MAG: NYN domain-containing protein [Gemmatimonadales bacterium]